MSNNEKNIGQSLVKGSPRNKMKFVIADNTIGTSKLKDDSVTPEKVNQRVIDEMVKPLTDAVEAKIYTETDKINAKIPPQASSSNQLADKAYVDDSISTATATYRGAYNLISDLGLSILATQLQVAQALGTTIQEADNNDYCYVQIPTSDEDPTEISRIDRYKFNGSIWSFEYSLNNSGFTEEQWAAINSGITSEKTEKLIALPTNQELTAMLAAKLEATVTSDPEDPEAQDEYQRLLSALYQALTDAQSLKTDYIGDDNYVYHWDIATQSYIKTDVYVKGDPGTTDYNFLINKPFIPTKLSELSDDAAHRLVTDALKMEWNLKYRKPEYGIPRTDLATEIRSSLNKADAAAPQSTTYTKVEVDSKTNDINSKIPVQASSENQLADKEYVNNSIATATATFRGTSATGLTEAQFLEWAESLTHDYNDYVYWNVLDGSGNSIYKRYKYNGSTWLFEYDINNTSFSSEEWAAIQSGITSAEVGKLSALPTNEELQNSLNAKLEAEVTGDTEDIDIQNEYQRLMSALYQALTDAQSLKLDYVGTDNYIYRWDIVNQRYYKTDIYVKGDTGTTDYNELTNKPVIPDELKDLAEDSSHRSVTDTEKNIWNSKQDALTFDSVPTQNSQNPVKSGGIFTVLQAIHDLIPTEASIDNKLVDKEYVDDSISTSSATFQGTYNVVIDLHLVATATHADIATALASSIVSPDNNDYCFVQIPTSTGTPTEIAKIERYKHTGQIWQYEYDINNSGFTTSQWAAINSGITSALVEAFGNKYDKPSGGIPKSDLSSDVQSAIDKADTAVQPDTLIENYLTCEVNDTPTA